MDTLQTQTFQLIPLTNLHESAVNPRRSMNGAKLQELTESIRSKGVLTPLLVRPDGNSGFEIAAGHRRYRAAKTAGVQEVPAIVREMTDKDFLEIIVIENDQREDVHPLEQAQGYLRLLETGYDVPALAGKVGRSESFIYQRLKLLDLIPDAQDAFLKDEITAGHAILIARLQNNEQAESLKWCHNRYTGMASVRDLQRFIEQNIHLDLHSAAFKKDDSNLVPQAGSCTECPKRTGFNALLFPDIAKKDTCTDPACYNAKIAAHIAAKIEKLQEDTDDPVLRLSTKYQDYSSHADRKEKKLTGEKPVYRKDYIEIGKKDDKCQSVRKGIIVNGDGRGKVITVCADPECKIHHRMNRYGSRVDMKEKARQKAEKEKQKLDLTIKERILGAMLGKEDLYMDEETNRMIATEICGKMWHEFQKDIALRHSFEPIKNQYGQKDFEPPLKKYIKTCSLPDLDRLIIEMSLAPEVWGWGEGKQLQEMAKHHGVDPKAIEAQVKGEWKAKKEKTTKKGKKDKSQTSAKKNVVNIAKERKARKKEKSNALPKDQTDEGRQDPSGVSGQSEEGRELG